MLNNIIAFNMEVCIRFRYKTNQHLHFLNNTANKEVGPIPFLKG